LIGLKNTGLSREKTGQVAALFITLTPANSAPLQILHPTPATAAPPPLQNLHTTPANSAPITITEPSIEPSDKPVREKKESLALPDWIEKESWDGFVAMRKAIRKPLTPRAMQLTVRELEKLLSAGEDVNAVLNQSTMNSWQGVFPLKNSNRGNQQRPEKFDPFAYVNRLRKPQDEIVIEH
jgi:hypothetical protein